MNTFQSWGLQRMYVIFYQAYFPINIHKGTEELKKEKMMIFILKL